MPSDFDENDPLEGDFGPNGESGERDSYDILSEWMVDKQGIENDWTASEIEEILREHGAIDEDGHVDIDALNDALDQLNLDYHWDDAEAWEDIISQYE